MKTPKRPRDPAQLAKLIVDIATGEVEEKKPIPHTEGDVPKVGSKGGSARAAVLTADERKAIASKAATHRWKKGSTAPARKEPV